MMNQRRFLLLREWLYWNAAFEKVSVVQKKRKRFFCFGACFGIGALWQLGMCVWLGSGFDSKDEGIVRLGV